MFSVAFEHPDGKGFKVVDGQPGWQSDGSYLTPEGEKLTTVVAKAAYLRTVRDWIIRPQMRTVQGVAGVDSNGGYVKQYRSEEHTSELQSLMRISYAVFCLKKKKTNRKKILKHLRSI